MEGTDVLTKSVGVGHTLALHSYAMHPQWTTQASTIPPLGKGMARTRMHMPNTSASQVFFKSSNNESMWVILSYLLQWEYSYVHTHTYIYIYSYIGYLYINNPNFSHLIHRNIPFQPQSITSPSSQLPATCHPPGSKGEVALVIIGDWRDTQHSHVGKILMAIYSKIVILCLCHSVLYPNGWSLVLDFKFDVMYSSCL